MATAKNGKVMYETGADVTTYTAMTDSGDHQYFTAGTVWSGRSGYAPSIRPNGIVSGINLVSVAASGSNDVVDIAAFTAYSEGTLHSVSAATDESVTRPATNVAKVNSITMTDAGAIAVVVGTDGASTTFSETRGAAGGPPYIPVDSVEIGQVRLTSSSAAAVTASEIKQIVGTHTETYNYPVNDTVDPVGKGLAADNSAETNAHLKLQSALPLIHTGDTAKKIYIQYYTPVFAEISKAADFVPAANSHSVSSTEGYRFTIASTSSSLGQGSFTAYLENGITDALVGLKDEILTFKFFPDVNDTPFQIMQGTLGLAVTNPANDQIQAACTISGEKPAAEFQS